jgi:hypothetical protein
LPLPYPWPLNRRNRSSQLLAVRSSPLPSIAQPPYDLMSSPEQAHHSTRHPGSGPPLGHGRGALVLEQGPFELRLVGPQRRSVPVERAFKVGICGGEGGNN